MPDIEQVNSKVVKAVVRPGQPLVARRGAMLAYTGRVTFRPVAGAPGQGGGIAGAVGLLTRGLAGESAPMMLAEGSGEVFYGRAGLHVRLVHLDGSQTLSVEADRLLAHSSALTSSVVFLGQQGGLRGIARGAATGAGLFTTQLSGTGDVALLAHGAAIALAVSPGAATGVDPQAYVAHTGRLDVEVAASLGWRDAVGRGSGEAFQLRVSGTGTVYVQASEKKL